MTNKTEILKLEREFWKTMSAGEHEKSAQMIAQHSALVHAKGVMIFTPADFIKMGKETPFAITDWSISDEKVLFPTPDSAVCTYRVKQTIEQDGKTETTTNQDTSVWVRDGSEWKCALHTEYPASAAQ